MTACIGTVPGIFGFFCLGTYGTGPAGGVFGPAGPSSSTQSFRSSRDVFRPRFGGLGEGEKSSTGFLLLYEEEGAEDDLEPEEEDADVLLVLPVTLVLVAEMRGAIGEIPDALGEIGVSKRS